MIETTDEAFDETIVDQTETGQSQTISNTKPEAQKPKVLFHRHQKILDRHIWYKYFAFSTAKT